MSLTLILLTYAIRQCLCDTFTGNTFSSDIVGNYKNHTIKCNDNEDCDIICNHPNACKHTNIRCPSTGTCAVQCNSGLSDNVCEGMTVDCPSNGDCNIQCNDDAACTDAIINGDTSYLSLSCHGDAACRHAVIRGRNTAYLLLQCGQLTHNECTSLSVYFPQSVNHHKIAKIDAGDSLCSTSDDDPLLFYAVNGWNDVDIIHYGGDWQNHIGVMRCGDDYDAQCSFKRDSWQCTNDNDLCNNPQLHSQTVSATVSSVIFCAVFSTLGICLFLIGFTCLCLVRYSQTHDEDIACDDDKFGNYAKSVSCSSLPPFNGQISSNSFTFNREATPTIATTSSFKCVLSKSKTPSENKTPVPSFIPHAQLQIGPKLELAFDKTDETLSPSSFSAEVKTNETEAEDTKYNVINYSTKTVLSVEIPKDEESFAATSITSSNDARISYVPPPPQEISQIMSILNESVPPSLSSFVRNHENGAYVMNQQPIPPSAQSSTGSNTATNTITAPDKGNGSDLELISSGEDSENGDRMVVDDNVHSIEYRLQIARNYLAENREME